MTISPEKEDIINMARVSIWLDTYDDIFSDFDSRPLSERAMSDDFIREALKMSRENIGGEIELKLLVPDDMRDLNTEKMVISTLHRQFRYFAGQVSREISRSKMRGYMFTLAGFSVMIACAYTVTLSEKSFFVNILRIILEPSGWFLVWTGFDGIFYTRKKKSEFLFNDKMGRAEIIFQSLK